MGGVGWSCWRGRGSLSVAVARLPKLRVGVRLTTDSTNLVMVLVTITASTTCVVFHLFWNLEKWRVKVR